MGYRRSRQVPRGPNKPRDAVVIEMNWNDNPWFPDVLKREKDEDYLADPEMAEHVWGGNYQVVSEGSYYAHLLVDAERSDRIGDFPYDETLRLRTSWDIRLDDYTAIWFIQDDGNMATVVDYCETSGEGADDIVATAMPEIFIPPRQDSRFRGWDRVAALATIKRWVPYKYHSHYLPHDVKVREWGGGERSRVQILAGYGLRGIHKGAATNPADRITAVRKLLPLTRFNNTPAVQLGIKRLRRYRRKWNDSLGSYTTPEHNDDSHGSDAFGEYAINCGIHPPQAVPKPMPKELSFTVTPTGAVISNMTFAQIMKQRERRAKRGLR